MSTNLPEFALSQQERLELAAHLRGTNLVETKMTDEMASDLARVTVDERFIPTRAGDTRLLIVTPKTPADGPRPMVLNIHGGGFVRGYQARDTVFCAHLAVQLDAVVIDLDYRLAPEFPFPTALHEGYDIAVWAVTNAAALGGDPARLAIGGHSAGGNLTAAICLMANESGAFRPVGQVMDYPFLDGITPVEDKLEPHSIFPPARLRAFSVCYAGVEENLYNPLLSPVLAQPEALTGLPPALIITAGLDPLRFEARRYAAMLIDAGIDVSLRNFADADHGFLIAGHSRWREGRATIVAWLAALFNR
ncbi:alpha/beta hydrolase [Pararhodobacter zhoushanensis]|uniref:Alpha/beta hydrolase n=1 Tax=Pararhodobacter zhoushanensis TaxID=2479545 RepID=A0ABT3H521_9RHOB|nr:alpha/beta hydrolase [Pararhodobacter zhoushanensis]MCW1934916.1 alpha/beta hydrolase [Pararhodobacter zhoushanensis]